MKVIIELKGNKAVKFNFYGEVDHVVLMGHIASIHADLRKVTLISPTKKVQEQFEEFIEHVENMPDYAFQFGADPSPTMIYQPE